MGDTHTHTHTKRASTKKKNMRRGEEQGDSQPRSKESWHLHSIPVNGSRFKKTIFLVRNETLCLQLLSCMRKSRYTATPAECNQANAPCGACVQKKEWMHTHTATHSHTTHDLYFISQAARKNSTNATAPSSRIHSWWSSQQTYSTTLFLVLLKKKVEKKKSSCCYFFLQNCRTHTESWESLIVLFFLPFLLTTFLHVAPPKKMCPKTFFSQE